MRMDLRELSRHLRAAYQTALISQSFMPQLAEGVAHWSTMFRRVVLLISFVLILAVSAACLWSDPWQRLDAQTHESGALKIRYTQLATQIATKPIYEQRTDEIEAQFGQMLKMIPSSLETVQVLDQITRAARENGLQLQWFKPVSEIREEAYVILPVDIRLVGTYHAVGRFLEAVSRMPHLITVDVLLEAVDASPGQLVLATRIKAYRGDVSAAPLPSGNDRRSVDAAR